MKPCQTLNKAPERGGKQGTKGKDPCPGQRTKMVNKVGKEEDWEKVIQSTSLS